jgi:8-oxo-dGTP diphosphatase
MIQTSLIYIEQEDCYLLLHRIKKEKDVNKDKWIGVGGKFLPDETPLECALREAKEETGLDLIEPEYRGIVDFKSTDWPEERMHLFWANRFEGALKECEEGQLEWVPKSRMNDLPQWEGDRIFLRLLAQNVPFFHLELAYEGDTLVKAVLDGKSALPSQK